MIQKIDMAITKFENSLFGVFDNAPKKAPKKKTKARKTRKRKR